MPMTRHPFARQRGATLVELLVSFLIVSFGLLALLALQNNAIKYNKTTELRATATLLAACPTAVNVFIQTRKMGVFARGAAEAVIAGTVLSALTLSLIAHFLA